MQTLPGNWASIRSGNYRYETMVTIAGVEYTEENILSLSTTVSLCADKPAAVGVCAAKEFDLTVIDKGDIPRMAEIAVFVRPLSDTENGEWLPKGTFFIDTRRKDTSSGALVIHGYDAMLKMEKAFLEDDEDLTGWPKTMPEVMAEIAARIGVELDERNVLRDYLVEPPVGYTMREVAGWIAAAHAGNWTITDAGKLRLVRLNANFTGFLVDEYGRALLFDDGTRILV
jgi:hypothetical protein